MLAVEFKNISKKFGAQEVLKNISLDIPQGEFLVLVGPSGCGKSTLLRTVSGLERPDSGDIFLNRKNVNTVEPQNRDISMVFQSYALYPHLTVYENMAFSLKLKKMHSEEIKKRVHEAAEILKIHESLNKKPKELSGGQRQRVALGRALVRQAPVILFDEPLSNLDAHLRQQMRIEIKRIHSLLKNTMIYVTHDQVEATTMGDRIAILNKGRIEQLDTPYNIYHKPKNIFVASFIGTPEMNLIPSSIFALNENYTLGIRPEDVCLYDQPQANSYEGIVDVIENLGPNIVYHVKIKNEVLRALVSNEINYQLGQKVHVKYDPNKASKFDPKSNERIL